jgi:hypothetical protein
VHHGHGLSGHFLIVQGGDGHIKGEGLAGQVAGHNSAGTAMVKLPSASVTPSPLPICSP